MKPSEILRELKKFPNKVLGQNFLVDESVSRDMIETAEISEDETVVEIGPGLGALTFPLLTHAKRVIAIEADREFATYLQHHKSKKLTVIAADALKIDWDVDIEGSYKVVANIPYSITFPLLRKAFLLEHRPSRLVLLVQKEVAERLVAKPGSGDRGIPTVRVEANGTAKVIRWVKPGCFYPRPKVDSAIVEITINQLRESEIFWPSVEAGFGHKRSTLANAINKSLKIPKTVLVEIINKIDLNPMARAQELDFEAWVRLSKELRKL